MISRNSVSQRLARSAAVALVAAMVTTAMVIGPVAAASGDRGSIVECSYKLLGEHSPYWGGKLIHIDVTAPTMYALKTGSQKVAWRFRVERINFESPGSPDTWKQTYISPREFGTATGSVAATFTKMGVGVSLPHADDWNDVYYRVKLVLFWYRSNDTVQEKVVHKMVHYDNILDGEHAWNDSGDYSCPGGHSAYTE